MQSQGKTNNTKVPIEAALLTVPATLAKVRQANALMERVSIEIQESI